MSCIAIHSQTLRERGYRMTPQRLAILEALHHEGHLSPAGVYGRVRATGMTEATVYRTLEFLVENRILFAAADPHGHLTYELAGSSHHHITCRNCGAQIEIAVDEVEGLLEQIEHKSGYRLQAGHLTFFGLCPVCQDQTR